MAGFTLTRPDVFPEGTEVGAYPASNWPTPGIPSGKPVGAATVTKKVEEGSAAFTGLTNDTAYWAVAEVAEEVWVYVGFVVSEPPEVTGPRDEPEKALKNLLAALDEKGLIVDGTTTT